jgi:hypothetical protein
MCALGVLERLIYVYDRPVDGSTSIKSDPYKSLAENILNEK